MPCGKIAPSPKSSRRHVHVPEALPATTVLTVPQTGIYRISAYMITTSSTSVDHYKYLNLSWSDEAGAESNYYFLVTDAVDGPPSAYGFGGFGGTPENNFTVRAVAGTPIAYSVTVDGYGPGGTYDLFIVVERLI